MPPATTAQEDDRPKRAYRDEPFDETVNHVRAEMPDDRPMSPIAESQMALSESLGSIRSAVNRLTQRLMPVASDNLRKIENAAEKALAAGGTPLRERRGTSPTLEMIEQQQAMAQHILDKLNTLTENLEV